MEVIFVVFLSDIFSIGKVPELLVKVSVCVVVGRNGSVISLSQLFEATTTV